MHTANPAPLPPGTTPPPPPPRPRPGAPDSTDRCQRPIMAAQQALYGELQDFQERMQRCLVRCQDTASAGLPRDREPSAAQVEKAQGALLACMDGCGREFAGGMPKLRGSIEAAFKKIPKS